jgi:membrane protein DedA with SNARE-associated domain
VGEAAGIPILESITSFVYYVMGAAGLVGLCLLMVQESFGIPPVPAEIILPLAGSLVLMGEYSFWAALLVALVGSLAGSIVAYAVGRWGRTWLDHRYMRRLGYDPKYFDRMDDYFRRRGPVTVLVMRLVPIIRTYISFPAGAARMDLKRFSLYTTVGNVPFVVALIYVGYYLGQNWQEVFRIFSYLDYLVVAGLVILGLYAILRWRRVIGPGWPPKLTRSTESHPPEAAGPPGGTGQ